MKESLDQAGTDSACAARLPRSPARPGDRRRGAIGVMFAVLLPVLIGFYALALDLARIYNRKAEMQTIADTVAIAAAKKLNGTTAGIDAALSAARDVVEYGSDPDVKPRYAYGNSMVWSDAAIMFSKSSDGSTGWLSAGAAAAAPLGLAYVKVDTSLLDSSYGAVDMFFAPVLPATLSSVNVGHTAVAGRGRISVTPLGICDMSTGAAHFTERVNAAGYEELVEYGFRRGVSYNLLMLNPQAGSTTGANFLIDPISLSGASSSSRNFMTATVGPYVCTGTMAVPKLINETVSVQAGFPLTSLVNHLNSRFDMYGGGACDPSMAPPDTNVKQYVAGPTLAWMSPAPPVTSQTAASDTSIRLQTKADLDPPNNLNTTTSGPLWAFARAVPWSSYTSGVPEPAGGYTPFSAAQLTWDKLYGTSVGLGAYPSSSTPYASLTQQPSSSHRPGVAGRRVLNVPILDCSAMPSSTAKVLAIGKFFMTVPAVAGGTPSTNVISAEFAGTTPEVQAGGQVGLIQ